MTKDLLVYCPSPIFSKTYTFLYFYILSHLFIFSNNFPPPPHLPICLFFFIKSPQPRFHKSYPQSKTFLNILAVPSSAVFCSNAVPITTYGSSMHFFSFFDVLPSASTTSGMTLMPLMFRILLISLFSSWYLSMFSLLFFINSYVCFLFTTTISGFLPVISVTLDHNILQNLHFFIFNNTFWSMFIPFFTSFQVVFPTQFPMNYSCNIIVPSLVLLLCRLFTFTHSMRYCFTFLVTHSTKW